MDIDEIVKEYSSKTGAGSGSAQHDVPLDDSTAQLKELKEFFDKVRQEEITAPIPTVPPAPEEVTEKTAPIPRIEQAENTRTGSFAEQIENFEVTFAPSDLDIPEPPAEDYAEDVRPPREPLLPKLVAAIRGFRRKKPPKAILSVREAAVKLTRYMPGINVRFFAAFILCLPLIYITFAPSIGLPVPPFAEYTSQPYTYLLIVSAGQILVMLCAADVLAIGLSDLARFHPGMESLLLISNLACLMQVFSLVALDGFIGFLPFCMCNALGTAFAVWGRRQQLDAYRRSYKAVCMGRPVMVYKEDKLWKEYDCYLKADGTTDDFVEHTEAPDLARRFAAFFAPLTIVACIVTAVLSSFGQGRWSYFFWALSAVTSASAPFVSSLVFSMPFLRVARRLAASGSAIAGWTAAKTFTGNTAIVLTDTDLFPAGSINFDGMKVFGGYSYDRVAGNAASLIAASGSGLIRTFQGLLQNGENALRNVEHLSFYENGIGGEIGGDRVLFGGANFIISMGVRLPKELNTKNAVYVTINTDLAGIFALTYGGAKSVSRSLGMLRRLRMPQIIAARDFTINETLVMHRYKRADEELLRYPAVEERLALSESEHDPVVRPVAAVMREGLEPFAESAAGGIRLRKIARLNLVFYCISAVLGLLIAFYLTHAGAAAMLTPSNMTLFLLTWCLPVVLISWLADKY